MSDLNAIVEKKHDNKEIKSDEKSSQSMQQSKCPSFEEECNEHMVPSIVDTSEVLGNILQVKMFFVKKKTFIKWKQISFSGIKWLISLWFSNW